MRRPVFALILAVAAFGPGRPSAAYGFGTPVLDAPEARLVAPALDPGAHFGGSVAACGETLVVGAPDDDLFASRGGAAYVYRRQDGALMHVQTLLPPVADRLSNWAFGLDVDIVCGFPIDVIAVAYEPDNGAAIGGAYVYERDSAGIWQLVSELAPVLAATGDDCGAAVALDAAVVGREGEDVLVYRGALGCPAASRAGDYTGGAAYLFERQAGAGGWGGGFLLVQDEDLVPGDQHPGERFGAAVDLHANQVVVGTPDDFTAGTVGAVHLFGGGGAAPCSKLVPSTVAANGHFGWSVSIDPWTLAAGAFGEDEPGEVDAGAAYLWNLWGAIELCDTANQPVVTDFDQRLTLADAQAPDQLGLSVVVATPYLVASLHGHHVGAFNFAGGAVVFELGQDFAWSIVGRLEPELGIGGSELVGQGGVALAGAVVYAGAPNDSAPPSSAVGALFAWDVAEALTLIFADSFESGDTVAWSTTSG